MKITNADFLSSIFPDLKPDEYCWATVFTNQPDTAKGEWAGNRIYPDQVEDTPFGNAYFCVSALRSHDAKRNRKKVNFNRLMCVVLDDAEKCDLAPSWKLETSTDNYQVGFMLAEPIENVEIADRLHKALATQNLIKSDKSGNNTVRYVRLPVGLNTKYQPNFQCVLQVWNPELRFTLDELCDALGLDLGLIANGAPDANTSVYEPPTERTTDEQLIRQIITAESYHDPLNKLIARYAQRGMDANAIVQSVQGFMKAGADRSERWQSRFNDIARSTQGAIDKFAPKEISNEPLNLLPEYEYSSDVLKPVEFVIDGFISNRLTLIAGAPGVGKSTCLVSLAAIAAGIMVTDGITAELNRKVFYVTEDAEQIERIIYGMKAQRLTTLTHEQIRARFKIIHARRRPAHEVAQMVNAARSLGITEHQSGYAIEPLIVLDTSNATLDLDNENDNSEAGKAISAIKESLGSAALWIVGHTAKAIKRADLENLSFRGAGAFEGDCHATCYLFQDEQAGKDIRFLALGKHRYVSSYQEMKIDTVLGKVQVSTAWGTIQECWYCVGIPKSSSAKHREQLKQATIDDAIYRNEQKLKKRIIQTVWNVTQKGDAINRSGVKRLINGKGETLSRLIGELIAEGWITETKAANKRGFDLHAAINPSDIDFDLDEGTIGNESIEQSIKNLLNESFPPPYMEQQGMIDDGHILPHQSPEIRLRE